MASLLGLPHYTVTAKYGYRETLIARVATRSEAAELALVARESGMYAGRILIVHHSF